MTLARRSLLRGAGALAALPLARPALAQAWPAKPLRLIVPLVPGGTTDLIARALAEPLGRMLGQPVVVENRPGANGWIANDYVMRERPDGYTLIVNNVSTHSINSALAPPDRSLLPTRGLTAITNLIEASQLLMAPASLGATSIPAFIEKARASPAPLVYCSAGIGSYQHIDMEAFAKTAGISMTHLPMRGAGEMVTVILRGDAKITEFNIANALPYVQTGQIAGLAVVAPKRVPQLPDVPTTLEFGFNDLTTVLWNGLFAPAGTPAPIIDTIFRHVAAILHDQEVIAALDRQMVRVALSRDAADFNDYVARDMARWVRLAKEFGITLNG
jgi:tripartite-type tricarboxylate transporter receptor subunit TctC